MGINRRGGINFDPFVRSFFFFPQKEKKFGKKASKKKRGKKKTIPLNKTCKVWGKMKMVFPRIPPGGKKKFFLLKKILGDRKKRKKRIWKIINKEAGIFGRQTRKQQKKFFLPKVFFRKKAFFALKDFPLGGNENGGKPPPKKFGLFFP